jgi:tetratricopeptide (TPR) repeat protein/TolB-like protein
MAVSDGATSAGGLRWKWWQVAVVCLLLAVAAGIAWRTLSPPRSSSGPATAGGGLQPNRIAIVPFTNRTGEPTLDALGERAADEIAGQLNEMENLQVVPPSAVASKLAEKRTEANVNPRILVQDVAVATSAGLVFTGVIDAAGADIELRGVLEDTTRGQVVGAFAPVAAEPSSPGPAMRELAKEVYICASDHLHPSLAFGAGEEWPDVETYQEFVKRLRLLDRKNYLHFLELFQANPKLTRVRLSVAFSFLNSLALRSASEVLESEHLDESNLNRHQAAVTRALRLWTGGQYDLAYRLFRDELMISPENTTLRHAAARCALFANRPAATVALYRDRIVDRAVPPSMYLLMAADAAAALHMLDNDEAAYDVLDRARTEIPSSMLTDWCLLKQISLLGATGDVERIEALLEEAMGRDFGRYEIVMARLGASHELRAHGFHDASMVMAEETLELLAALCEGPPESCPELGEVWLKALLIAGRDTEAAGLAKALDGTSPGWIAAWCLSGIAAARVGDTTTAQSLFDRMNELPAESDRTYNETRVGDLRVGQAMIAAQAGDLNEALQLLRTGITGGALRVEHNLYLHELRHNIFLEPLWDHPEFQEMMRPRG